jgi:hypothetical protein
MAKLKKFLLRYYPPGVILEYESGGQLLQKSIDLLDLTPEDDVEVVLNHVMRQVLHPALTLAVTLHERENGIREKVYVELLRCEGAETTAATAPIPPVLLRRSQPQDAGHTARAERAVLAVLSECSDAAVLPCGASRFEPERSAPPAPNLNSEKGPWQTRDVDFLPAEAG